MIKCINLECLGSFVLVPIHRQIQNKSKILKKHRSVGKYQKVGIIQIY